MRTRTSAIVASMLMVYCAAALAQPATQPVKQTAPPEPEGMVQLFNGKDLTGWEGDLRLWSVKDGVIRGETTAENPTYGTTFLVW